MLKFYLKLGLSCLFFVFAVAMVSSQNTANKPGQPENVKVVATNVVGKSFTLAWDPVPGVTGYYVYMDTSRSPNGDRIGTRSPITTTTFEIQNITVNTDRSFWVRAYNDNGEGPSSAIVNFNLRNTKLNAPTNLKVVATNVAGNSFTLTWDPVPGATGYYVNQGTRNRLSPPEFNWERKVSLRPITTPETEVQRITLNTNYAYRVTAYNDDGEGPQSDHIEFNLERK